MSTKSAVPRTQHPLSNALLTASRRQYSLANHGKRRLPTNTCNRSKTPTSKCWDHSFRRHASSNTLSRTALYDLHVQHGGKLVPFAGYSMPVQYADQSISSSHLFTRSHASLFDVSHMVQHRLSGPGAQGLLTRFTPAAVGSIPYNQSTLSCLLLPGTGGIVDDAIITRLGPEEFYFVTNAACREKDLAFLKSSIDEFRADGGGPLTHEVLDDHALIALQGPLAPSLLEPLLVSMTPTQLQDLHFGQCARVTLKLSTDLRNGPDSSPILISRGGYTGEDGFELSVPAAEAIPLASTLLELSGSERLRLAGLGARDTLRLEAGMCLYGHDIDETTTPVEAGLSWVVAKDRRTEGGFNGSEVILRQIMPRAKGGSGVDRRRVGLLLKEGGPPAREGAVIEAKVGEGDSKEHSLDIGKVTSGAPSPTLGRNIAMGYVKDGFHKQGTELRVIVRGKQYPAEVTKMPFVQSRYWKGGVSPG